MDFANTNETGLRDTVFNTINLLTEIESGAPCQERQQPQMPQRPGEIIESQLSNQFVSGIKDKMLDPSRIDKLQQGKGEALDQLKYNMERQLETFQKTMTAQQSEIGELKGIIENLKSDISQMRREAQCAAPIQPVMQQQPVQPQIQQPIHVPANGAVEIPVQKPQERQPMLNHSLEQPQAQAARAPVQEPNPRVGNYNSEDVSIEKYFYCGK